MSGLWTVVSVQGTQGPLIEEYNNERNIVDMINISNILLIHPTIPCQATEILQKTKNEQYSNDIQDNVNNSHRLVSRSSSHSSPVSPPLCLSFSPNITRQSSNNHHDDGINTPLNNSIENPQSLSSRKTPVDSSGDDDLPPPLLPIKINENTSFCSSNSSSPLYVVNKEESLLMYGKNGGKNKCLSMSKEMNILPGGEEILRNYEDDELIINGDQEKEEEFTDEDPLPYMENKTHLRNIEKDLDKVEPIIIPNEKELVLSDDQVMEDFSHDSLYNETDNAGGNPICTSNSNHIIESKNELKLVERSTSVTPVLSYEYLSCHEVEESDKDRLLSCNTSVFVVNDNQRTTVLTSPQQHMSPSSSKDESMIDSTVATITSHKVTTVRKRAKKKVQIAAVFGGKIQNNSTSSEIVQNSDQLLKEDIPLVTCTSVDLQSKIDTKGLQPPTHYIKQSVQDKSGNDNSQEQHHESMKRKTPHVLHDRIISSLKPMQQQKLPREEVSLDYSQYETNQQSKTQQKENVQDEIVRIEKHIQLLRRTLQEKEVENELVQIDDEKSRLIDRVINANLHSLTVSFWNSHYKSQLDKLNDKLPEETQFDFESHFKLNDLKASEQSLKLQTDLFL